MFCVGPWLPNLTALKLCFYSGSVSDDWMVSEGRGRAVSSCLRDWRPLLWEEGCS